MAMFLWVSDRITLQGERTVYTVQCKGGTWLGGLCNGDLQASDRSLKAHREVLFWTSGANEPSGKFSDCDVQSGRDWTCRPTPDAQRTITLQMKKGEPVPDASGPVRLYHAVAKWRWYLLKAGVPVGSNADNWRIDRLAPAIGHRRGQVVQTGDVPGAVGPCRVSS